MLDAVFNGLAWGFGIILGWLVASAVFVLLLLGIGRLAQKLARRRVTKRALARLDRVRAEAERARNDRAAVLARQAEGFWCDEELVNGEGRRRATLGPLADKLARAGGCLPRR